MIAEIFIKNDLTSGKMRVVVYPTKGERNPRVYVEPTKSSCKRLERMMREYTVRPYLWEQRIVVWISR